jgi:hypothetical protein
MREVGVGGLQAAFGGELLFSTPSHPKQRVALVYLIPHTAFQGKSPETTHFISLFWKGRSYKLRDDGGGCSQGYI